MKNRFQARGDEHAVEFAELVITTATIAVTSEIARNQFEHCGYAF